MVGAYVDGRPIPSDSSFFTSAASEYLGGGSENFWRPEKWDDVTDAPFASAGSFFDSSSSSSSVPSI